MSRSTSSSSAAIEAGLTTWTTAAVDKRVIAIVPFVIDMLNIEPSFVHHWEAYGFGLRPWATTFRRS